MQTINGIKTKLQENKVTILRADKGNTIVIWYTEEKITKTQEFIHNNHFSNIHNDPIHAFQKEIRKVINGCNHTIRKEDKWKYVNLNPTAPNMKDLPKIHKDGTPIRLIVKWRNAPAYKLVKLLSKLIEIYVLLPCDFNVKNSIHLIEDLENTPIDNSTKFASLDINNMYSNIPTKEVINILKLIGTQLNINTPITKELISMTSTVMKQNYFTFQNNYYAQNKGLAMGAPTSSALSEVYLQFMENTRLQTILTENNILGYFSYVDDILIVYNEKETDIHLVLEQFNNTITTMKFSIEKEMNNSINFLDITIHKNHGNISFSAYRKPTTTDMIIPKDSCHPQEHKQAAIGYLLTRMNNYHLERTAEEHEYNTVKQILRNNKYNPPGIDIIVNKHTEEREKQDYTNSHRWAKFTYVGRETKYITKLFKNLLIKIALPPTTPSGEFSVKNQYTRIMPATCLTTVGFTDSHAPIVA